MADRESGGCCRCCFSFIITLGLTSLFMWLSLRADNPKCTIKHFYLPVLDKTLNDSKNSSLIFELKLDNGNKDKGIYYDPINLTFYDNPNRSRLLGNFTIPGFRQGQNKKAKRIETLQVNTSLATARVSPNGSAVFRVDMATKLRFRIMFWKTKRHNLILSTSVEVDEHGAIPQRYQKKGFRLKSAAPEHGGGCALMGLLVGFMVLVLLNFR
ncbi:protein NDR1-like [Corylus avellana]|uniref:protein NDR1-like n=1 Tax=Corylus avellana TaxID=13451 RepID=UPI001E21CB99|nr:protein NDR1-like [Corylus avellana]